MDPAVASRAPLAVIENSSNNDGARSTAVMREFSSWLFSRGVQTHPAVVISHGGSDGSQWGLYCKMGTTGSASDGVLRRGTVLFSVPRTAFLNSRTSGLEVRCMCFQRSRSSTHRHVMQDFRSNDWARLCLGVMHETSKRENSHWKPYLDAFASVLPKPKRRPRNEREAHAHEMSVPPPMPPGYERFPIYWNKDERASMLGMTSVGRNLGCAEMEQQYGNNIAPFTELFPECFHPDFTSFEEYLRIGSWAAAYSFTEHDHHDSENDRDWDWDHVGRAKRRRGCSRMSMVPLADLLNHCSVKHNASLFWERDSVAMVAIKDIHAGEQIFNTYGRQANSELLRKYGFVDASNPWEDESVTVDRMLLVQCILQITAEYKSFMRHSQSKQQHQKQDGDAISKLVAHVWNTKAVHNSECADWDPAAPCEFVLADHLVLKKFLDGDDSVLSSPPANHGHDHGDSDEGEDEEDGEEEWAGEGVMEMEISGNSCASVIRILVLMYSEMFGDEASRRLSIRGLVQRTIAQLCVSRLVEYETVPDHLVFSLSEIRQQPFEDMLASPEWIKEQQQQRRSIDAPIAASHALLWQKYAAQLVRERECRILYELWCAAQ
eukprot:ANDGO_08291.mRNA.1 Ribosomal lysine N-methyltransferase 4